MTRHAWGLLTTPYAEEVEALCDRIAIIDAREIVALGTQSDPKAMSGRRKEIAMEADCDDTIIETFEEVAGKGKVVREGGMSIMTDDPKEVVRQLFVDILDEESAQLRIRDPSLEDVFFQLTGRRIREDGDAEEVAKSQSSHLARSRFLRLLWPRLRTRRKAVGQVVGNPKSARSAGPSRRGRRNRKRPFSTKSFVIHNEVEAWTKSITSTTCWTRPLGRIFPTWIAS